MSRPRRRLTQLANRPARPLRLRLIDAVALGAAALLVLKLTAFFGAPAPESEIPAFGRVIVKARTGWEPTDPLTTGSISSKDGEGANADGAKANGSKAEPKITERPEQVPLPEMVSPSERAILEKLARRRDTLKERTDALDLREQMLEAAEKKLESGVDEMRQAEEKIDLGGAKRAEAERAGLKGIVTMYETMKPKDAARVFDRLALDVLVPIVLGMNPRKMADVLALMTTEPAEKLTVALANRARGVEANAPQRGEGGLPPNELSAIDPGPPIRPATP